MLKKGAKREIWSLLWHLTTKANKALNPAAIPLANNSLERARKSGDKAQGLILNTILNSGRLKLRHLLMIPFLEKRHVFLQNHCPKIANQKANQTFSFS
jgi:hypothetical protein